jgi:hypothetical protein
MFDRNSLFYINNITYKSFSVFGPRIQKDWQLVFLYEGSAEVQLNGLKPYTIYAGEISLFNPGTEEKFQFAKDERTSHGWCTGTPYPPRRHMD